jgi:hypothetical protein
VVLQRDFRGYPVERLFEARTAADEEAAMAGTGRNDGTTGTGRTTATGRTTGTGEDTDTTARIDDGIQQNAEKDPDQWVTGGEPMTGPQASYLHTLGQEAHEDVPLDLTKAEASKKIEELQEETGRGR